MSINMENLARYIIRAFFHREIEDVINHKIGVGPRWMPMNKGSVSKKPLF